MAYNVLTSDIEARWRPLSAAESEVAEVLIQDASLLLDTLRPNLAAAVVAGLVPEQLVVHAIVEAIQRVLRNPDLLRAQNITDGGGVGITYGLGEDTNHSLPRLRFSIEDLVALDRSLAAAGGLSRVVSRRLTIS